MPQNRDLLPITTYLPQDLIDKVEREAQANERSVSAQIRFDLARLYEDD